MQCVLRKRYCLQNSYRNRTFSIQSLTFNLGSADCLRHLQTFADKQHTAIMKNKLCNQSISSH